MSKLFVTSKDGPMPKRGGKKHADPLDKLPDWMLMKSYILSGKAKPMEEFGMHLYAELDKITGVSTRRVAAERLRRFIRAAHLENDYHVEAFRPDPENAPEHTFIKVTYQPPEATAGHKKRA